MKPVTRRAFIGGSGAAALLGWELRLAPHAFRRALAETLATVIDPTGTTLESSILPTGPGPYRRLTQAPGWPIVVREDLAAAQAGRADRRLALASIVHLTDIHIIDAQSTSRVEFLDRYADQPGGASFLSSAYRSQEALTCQVTESMVQKINAIAKGPITGRPFDVAVSTGDNIDNQQQNEMEWFLALLDGGPVTPNSGGPTYEGIQDQHPLTYDGHYWHPHDERPAGDHYKSLRGFPAWPGLLDQAIAPFTATGLRTPWISVYGNHDGLAQGNVRGNAAFEGFGTGSFKVVSLPAGVTAADFAKAFERGDPSVVTAFSAAPGRPVTPDPARRYVTPQDWAAAHLASTGPGPAGHGFTEENAADGHLYFTFEVAPGVLGISLDTVNPGGESSGSVGEAQLRWLELQLANASSRYFDAAGVEVTTGRADQLVVLFSHHSLASLDNKIPNYYDHTDRRHGSATIRSLVHRFPNVVAWVNGHSHENRCVPRPDTRGRTQGFWEILTSAHIDWPEHARLVEIVDNADGTLSIFATLVDHAGPVTPTIGDGSVLNLASASRELSVNDPHADPAAIGTVNDRNVELLLRAPF